LPERRHSVTPDSGDVSIDKAGAGEGKVHPAEDVLVSVDGIDPVEDAERIGASLAKPART
jgi:hypothetical protein